MTEMNIKTNTKVKSDAGIQDDYVNAFMPKVHKIGRITMIIAFFLAFLPVAYFIFIKGYQVSIQSYIAVAVAIAGLNIGIWLSEPLAYWPVLGSAGTYMGYLSGNVGAQRFPVALNVQSTMKTTIHTPRGQVVTIIGIAASVFSNLILLLIFILAGDQIIKVLPDTVMASFAFVMVGLLPAILIMAWNGQDGIVKGFMAKSPYVLLTIILKLIIDRIPALMAWGMALDVAACIILGYILFRRDSKKDEVSGETTGGV